MVRALAVAGLDGGGFGRVVVGSVRVNAQRSTLGGRSRTLVVGGGRRGRAPDSHPIRFFDVARWGGGARIGCKIVLDQCELLNLTVKKSMQSKGIGTLILLQLKELCMALNIKYIFLEVRRSNATAIKLYEQNGFNETGIRKNYYKTVTGMEDAILMGLSL